MVICSLSMYERLCINVIPTLLGYYVLPISIRTDVSHLVFVQQMCKMHAQSGTIECWPCSILYLVTLFYYHNTQNNPIQVVMPFTIPSCTPCLRQLEAVVYVPYRHIIPCFIRRQHRHMQINSKHSKLVLNFSYISYFDGQRHVSL